jgi:hypothetical protein
MWGGHSCPPQLVLFSVLPELTRSMPLRKQDLTLIRFVIPNEVRNLLPAADRQIAALCLSADQSSTLVGNLRNPKNSHFLSSPQTTPIPPNSNSPSQIYFPKNVHFTPTNLIK